MQDLIQINTPEGNSLPAEQKEVFFPAPPAAMPSLTVRRLWRADSSYSAYAAHEVLAALLDVCVSKAEIRLLSRRAGLPTWDRPASACLASRLPYGTEVTPERLGLVERGEAALRALGFRQFRVRLHDKLA